MPRCAFPTSILLQIGISALTTPTQLCRGIPPTPYRHWKEQKAQISSDSVEGSVLAMIVSVENRHGIYPHRFSHKSFPEVPHIVLVISYQHADERHGPRAPRGVTRHTASMCCMLELVWWGMERRIGRWRCTLLQALGLLSRIHLVEERASSLKLSWGLHTYTTAHAHTS